MQIITDKIFEVIKRFHEDHKTTPWDINNGLCDEFARTVVSELDFANDELFEIEFLNITDTADENWRRFYKNTVDEFNLKPTRNLNDFTFMSTLRTFADTSHMWIVYKTKDICLHFDAESPMGVDNPFKLKTFDKFLKVAHLELTRDELINHLKEHKENSVKEFKELF